MRKNNTTELLQGIERKLQLLEESLNELKGLRALLSARIWDNKEKLDVLNLKLNQCASSKKVAIRCPASRHGEFGNAINGDYFLALDLMKGLLAQNYNAEILYRDDTNRASGSINLVMYGWQNKITKFNPGTLNLLYLYSHPTDWKIRELRKYDAICTASHKLYDKLKQKGINVYLVPQFTNPEKFYPEMDNACRNKVFIAGNKIRPSRAELFTFLANSGVELSVYGRFWGNLLGGYLKGEFLPNEQLYRYYSSADIVLNDTYPEMREYDIIPNRIYDVTACKGFVISDYIPAIERIYGDCIPMYRTKEECLELLNYYLAHPRVRRKKAEKAYQITLANFTADIIAEKFKRIITALVDSAQGSDTSGAVG